ncbi:hypothetical protein CSPX01_12980 [Colletotrichum filicis]|nr:hypothetical protein CSPX01_12980 [Colletotrichum filicis]
MGTYCRQERNNGTGRNQGQDQPTHTPAGCSSPLQMLTSATNHIAPPGSSKSTSNVLAPCHHQQRQQQDHHPRPHHHYHHPHHHHHDVCRPTMSTMLTTSQLHHGALIYPP